VSDDRNGSDDPRRSPMSTVAIDTHDAADTTRRLLGSDVVAGVTTGDTGGTTDGAGTAGPTTEAGR
jgi:hypothetical protein